MPETVYRITAVCRWNGTRETVLTRQAGLAYHEDEERVNRALGQFRGRMGQKYLSNYSDFRVEKSVTEWKVTDEPA